MAVPRLIWMLWLQGWDEAPDIVRACAASWERHNPGWEVRCLTRSRLEQLLGNPATFDPRFLRAGMPPEALSDLARLELLARHGGVWADATTYCLAPLDGWLGAALGHGFFAFDRPGANRMLASWFLVAAPASPIILRWRELALRYWVGRTARDSYFWLHDQFAQAYATDAAVRRAWDRTPKLSADGPHAFLPYEETLPGPVTDRARSIVETASVPLLKLTHRVRPAADQGTLYRWLCERER